MMAYVGTLDLAVSRKKKNQLMLSTPCVTVVVFSQAVNTVQQTVLIVTEEEKKFYIFDFIRNMLPEEKVLVFVGKKLKWVLVTRCNIYINIS